MASTLSTAAPTSSKTWASRWAASQLQSSAGTAWARRHSATRSWASGRPSSRARSASKAKSSSGDLPTGSPGRRLFPSLTVDEHLRMIRAPGRARWSPDRVYELFPRLADRKRHGGAELSGGEQQMLAIGRALLTNPKLLVMDEPSEGLAPTIIEHLIESFRALEHEGVSILLIEQNLGVATALADRQLIMISGQIATETTAEALVNDPDAQRRYLGVEPLAERH